MRFDHILGLTLLVSACQREPPSVSATPPPPDEVWLTSAQVQAAGILTAPVEEHDLDDTILTSGRVALDDLRAAHVFSPVTGRVVSIGAQVGQRVKKGDPLVVIESPDVGSAVSDLQKAQADIVAAEHDLARKKLLFEQGGAGSLADVEAAQDNYRRAQAELERARQKQALLRVGVVDYVTQTYGLPSPIDGEVLLRNVTPGVEIQGQYSGGANQELFTIGELDKVWVIADLYEMDMRRIQLGATVEVTTPAYPGKSYKGQIDWVSAMVDTSSRAARVRCTLDNPGRELHPEMYAKVRISVDRKHALAIPRNALLRLGDAKIVMVELSGTSEARRYKRVIVDVDEGEANAMLEVKKGLTRGQKIVTSGAIILSQML